MRNKVIGFLVLTLLISAAVLPAVSSIDNDNVEPSKTYKPVILPFFKSLFNGDWDYWTYSPNMYSMPDGNVGIGTDQPEEKLDVVGTVQMLGFKMPYGAHNGYVLTVNDNGVGTWKLSAVGPMGPPGPEGPPGSQGQRGPSGFQGPQGVQGPQGDKGDTGDTGPQGDKGDTGDTGPQGDQGIQGEQGPQGDKGDKGDKGDSGDTQWSYDSGNDWLEPTTHYDVSIPSTLDVFDINAWYIYPIHVTASGTVSADQLYSDRWIRGNVEGISAGQFIIKSRGYSTSTNQYWLFKGDHGNYNAYSIKADGTVSKASDERLKMDIQPIDNALAKLLLLNGVFFKWDPEMIEGATDDLYIGMIAQKVEEVFPEIVETDENGYKGVDYAMLTPILIQALKELNEEKNQEIALLQQDIEDLENRLDDIEAQLGIQGMN